MGKTIPTIRVKNEGAKKTSLEYTFYDKTAECKQMRSGNGLPKEFEGIIYRFEQRIEKKKKIEEFFGTKSVFGDNPVTDGLVCRHIREHILETLVNNYAEAFMASINYASKILSEMPLERKKPGFALKLLNELKIREYEQHEIKIIDEEAFLYAVDSLQDPKNGGTKITAMIKHIEEYASEWDQREILRDPMVRMDGWELERFIWWMGYHLWLAIKYGLGVPDLPPEAEIRGEYSFCYGNCEEERKWKTFDRFRSRKRPHVKAMEERLKKYQSTISRKAA